MAKFRKKPIVIEAMQWSGDIDDIAALQAWGAPATLLPCSTDKAGDSLIIGTLEDGPNCEAIHVATPRDWIIRGVKGEFYPCKPDIFAATYEQVDPFGSPKFSEIPIETDSSVPPGEIRWRPTEKR